MKNLDFIEKYQDSIKKLVSLSLEEDLADGLDISGELIPLRQDASATILTRQPMVLCGLAWAEEVCLQINPNLAIIFLNQEGDLIKEDTVFARLIGPARSILSAERSILNFIQTLSATATATRKYVDLIKHTECKLLDTRKTIPGLRIAQKYAVLCGGGNNHRFGLYDAYLIKENHILGCGSIEKAVSRARSIQPEKTIEVEVENFDELSQAIRAKADIIMLDNFSISQLCEAVEMVNGACKLEASGNITLDNIAEVAETGVDFISVGAITKHIEAIDLSLRFD